MSDKFSYSKLNTYKGCPFKYKLNYVDKNYTYSNSIATEFGTSVHKAEESIAKSIMEKVPVDYTAIKNTFIETQFELMQKYPTDYFSADKSGRNYFEKAWDYLKTKIYRLENTLNSNKNLELLGTEIDFKFDFDSEHYFSGAIDRVIRDNSTGHYYIQDIKTWSVPEDEDELITPLQFVVYALAVKEIWKINTEDITCQYDLPLLDMFQNGGTNGFINRGIKKIEQLFESIKNEDYAPKQSPLCNYCSYCRTNPDAPEKSKNLCPYYSLWNRETRNKFDIQKHENEWQSLDKHKEILESFYKKYNIVAETRESE